MYPQQADSSGDGGDTLDEEEFMAAFDKLFGLKGKVSQASNPFSEGIDHIWLQLCIAMELVTGHLMSDVASKYGSYFPAAFSLRMHLGIGAKGWYIAACWLKVEPCYCLFPRTRKR